MIISKSGSTCDEGGFSAASVSVGVRLRLNRGYRDLLVSRRRRYTPHSNSSMIGLDRNRGHELLLTAWNIGAYLNAILHASGDGLFSPAAKSSSEMVSALGSHRNAAPF